MKTYLLVLSASLTLVLVDSCNNNTSHNVSVENKGSTTPNIMPEQKIRLASAIASNPEDFIPPNYVLFEKIFGDLNKDGLKDCILIIKGTDKNKLVNEDRGQFDRNRRGIIILLNTNEAYQLVVQNLNCFSSDQEDGGLYFAPELTVEAKKGNLVMSYFYGRYGNWSYTFRLQDSDFDLIGYDESDNRGPIISSETSINYLTKKKIVKENVNENAEGGDEVFKQSVTRINLPKIIKLSEIKDFDELVSEIK